MTNKPIRHVTRYSYSSYEMDTAENETGEWVKFTDYQALQARCEELEKDLKSKAENGCCIVEHGWRMSAEHKLKSALERVAELEKELQLVIKIGVEGQREINRKAHAEIAKLTRQRDILKKALEFYADGNNWSTINHMASVVTYDRLEYDKDLGDGAFQINEETNDKDVSGMRARKALREAEQE